MRYWTTGAFYAAIALYFAAGVLQANTSFPPIGALQQQLNVYPGTPLPKLVVWGGRSFQPYYLSAYDRGNGVYTVTVKLQ
jgi:hypothetical protein